MSDGVRPVILTTCLTEIEAAICLEVLRENGLECQMTGGHTAGLRAEAPGLVRVLVHESDLERARQVLKDARSSSIDIDWSKVDVGEPED